jgi:hypothetical protein
MLAHASAAKQFELTGQILEIKPERQEVLLKHDDIKGLHAGDDDALQGAGCSLLSGQGAGRHGSKVDAWWSARSTRTCRR